MGLGFRVLGESRPFPKTPVLEGDEVVRIVRPIEPCERVPGGGGGGGGRIERLSPFFWGVRPLVSSKKPGGGGDLRGWAPSFHEYQPVEHGAWRGGIGGSDLLVSSKKPDTSF